MNVYRRTTSLFFSLVVASIVLVALIGLAAGVTVASAAPAQGDCYATADGGTNTYHNTNANALRQAVAAASPGDEVWVAGMCAGAVAEGGSSQVVLLAEPITIVGYSYNGNWQYDPQTWATLDAEGGGRVVRIVGDVAVTLENVRLLNGETTAAGANGAGILAEDASVVISHSVVISNNASGSGSSGGGIFTTRDLTLVRTDVLSNSASSGGGISTQGVMEIRGGRFENNWSRSFGGAIHTYRSLTITGTRFSNNVATGSGAGAILSRGAGNDLLRLNNAYFESNRCTYQAGCSGGAIFAYNPVSMTGSTFTDNSTSGTGFGSGGGAIYALAEMEIRGSVFAGNQTPANGGAIYVQAPLTLRDSELRSNDAGRNGGGIWNSGALVIENSVIAENSSTSTGYNAGGIYNSGSLSLLASTIISNAAYNSGGIYNVEGSSLTVADNAVFRNNEARGSFGSGGAIGNRGTMVVEDTLFEANRGGSSGGGIDNRGVFTASQVVLRDNVADSGGGLANSGDASLEDALFEGNAAVGTLTTLSEPGGGAIRAGFGTIEVADSTFRNNHATFRGGAFYSASSLFGHLYVVNTKVISNAAASGGGFYMLSDVGVAASRVFSNSANVGGGMTIGGQSSVRLENNFIAGNEGVNGGDAVYFDGNGEEAAQLVAVYDTFAQPAGAGGSGVAIESAGELPGTQVELTNAIVSGYGVGVQLAGITDSLSIDGILWHNVGVTATGGIISVAHAYSGDPAFVAPGAANYHIMPGSAALDRAQPTAVNEDIDFEPRPQWAGPDLGADELLFNQPGIGNYVWEDTDGDGRQDAAEDGLAGVTVSLLDDAGTVISTTTTNTAGYYFFPVESAGMYQLAFEAPAGYRFSPPDQGEDDEMDSDAQPGSGRTPLFSFDATGIDHSWDAGLSQTLPDLFIDKQASTMFVNPDDSLTFRVTFGNRGVGVVSNVVITDLVPTALLTNISYEVAGVEITPTGDVSYTWQVAPIPAGTEGTITIRGNVRRGIAGGTSIENRVTIAGSEDEQSLKNNSDDVLVTVNDVGPIAVDDSGSAFTTVAGTAFTTGNVLENDRELNGEALTLVAVHSDSLKGQLVSNGDGTFTYDPAGAFANLGAGQTATDVFSYTIRDEGGQTDTATVTITVRGEGSIIYLPLTLKDAVPGAASARRPGG